MTEGIIRIYMSYLEPEDKGLIWMRPYLDKEGYELLFYGSKGWMNLCCPHNYCGPGNCNHDNREEKCDGLLELPCNKQ